MLSLILVPSNYIFFTESRSDVMQHIERTKQTNIPLIELDGQQVFLKCWYLWSVSRITFIRFIHHLNMAKKDILINKTRSKMARSFSKNLWHCYECDQLYSLLVYCSELRTKQTNIPIIELDGQQVFLKCWYLWSNYTLIKKQYSICA
jgi:hypothetical protein